MYLHDYVAVLVKSNRVAEPRLFGELPALFFNLRGFDAYASYGPA